MTKFLIIISSLLFLHISTAGASTSNSLCFNCQCDGIKVNCTGLKMTSIRTVTHTSDLQDFHLGNNSIVKIQDDSFHKYPKMRFLDLSENQISSISDHAFDANVKIYYIDLSHNLIEFLPEKLFEKLVLLRDVYLHENRIATIGAGLFSHTIAIEDLRLQKNEITSIDPEAFANLHHLTSLYLEDNKLETPYKDWLGAFHHKDDYEVYFDNNPWSCDCNMRQFVHWSKSHDWFTRGEHTSIPKCFNPERFLGTSIAQLTESNFVCENMTLQVKLYTIDHVLEGDEVSIYCAATGVPVPKMTITTKLGKILEVNKHGNATLILNPVKTTHTGTYICHASGTDEEGKTKTLEAITTVIVHSKGNGKVAGITIAILACIIILGVMIWVYRNKLSRFAKYKSIPNNSIYYEPQDVAGNTSHPVINGINPPLSQELYNSSEEDLEYSKDGEKEVLV